MNKRILKFDNIKGILIYLVVLAHLLYSYNYYNPIGLRIIVNFIYTFHMPLFLIVSGYFSRTINKKSLIKIFLLFILLNLSYSLYDYIITNDLNLLVLKYSSWYLLSLFIYRLIIYLDKNNKIKNNKLLVLIYLFLLSIITGFYDINDARIFSFAFFFFFGYLIDFKKSIDKKISIIGISIILIILLTLVTIFHVNLNFFMAGKYPSFNYLYLRLIIYILDIILFYFLYNVISNKNIPLFTKFGSNSLSIYIGHRILTLIINDKLYLTKYFYLITFVSSIIICFVLSINFIRTFLQSRKLIVMTTIILFSLIMFNFYRINRITFQKIDFISYEESREINNSISIGFVGDLILLENQVNDSLEGDTYDFDYMFSAVTDYFKKTDYMFGVLEGPVDDTKNYSVGNFYDGKKLYLNYPNSFLKSIKNSGIDLVTIANNHILDKGVDSVLKTKENLKKENLDYVGSSEKRRKIINIENLKVGVLAYTYGLNYYDEDEMFSYGKNITNYIVDSNSKYFKRVKKEVEEDFNYLKRQNVDLIVVLPHYGTQFSTKVDHEQKLWNKIFAENGADIVFGTHSHIVQPIEYIGNTIIFNSVGNFVNSYVEHDGDISMMAKVYINPKTKKIICGSVIPLLAVKDEKHGYYALPVYKTYYNTSKYREKLDYANRFVTKISLKREIDIKEAEEEYYYFPDGYKKHLKNNLILTENDKKSLIYQKITSNENICFVGDSITEGTKNQFHPWYEPLMNLFEEKKVYNFSKGGYTTVDIINNFETKIKNTKCDLTIINIGTNDIRYNLTNEKEYIENINTIIDWFNDSEIILLSPFRTTDKDKYLTKDTLEKKKLYDKYDDELKKMVDYNKIYYIDINNYINKAIKDDGEDIFLLDGVHPNNSYGIQLYSFAIMRNMVY